MENGATSKRKRLVKKYQAHAKVKEFEMKEVSSTAKLVQNFITKSDKGSNQVKIAQQLKRKISEIGDKQTRENSMEGRNKTLVDNVMNRSLRSSHNQVRSNVQLEEQPIPKKMKSKAKCPAMALDVFLHTKGVEVEREEKVDFESIGEDAGATEKEPAKLTNLKNNLKHPAMTLDAFLGDQGIHVEREEEHTEVPTAEDARSKPSPNNGEKVHIPSEEDYIGEHESDNFDVEGDQVMEEAHVEDISKAKKTRGKTRCLKIYARTWEEREEVTFDQGAAVGPTAQRVKDLTNFIGTMGRNSDFITLMYTNCKAVPKQIKKRIWKYINSKFILPKSSKLWVMTGVQEAWKRYKTRIKKKHFEPYSGNIEDMLVNRPLKIPEIQFRKLIAYWSIPSVKAMCVINSENCKKQQWRHKMGPINFARVRVDLREKKENKEEPNQAEIHIIYLCVYDKLDDLQEAGETPTNAFQKVFGKENPGRVQCYGRIVTKTSLKKNKEMDEIKKKSEEKVTALKTELDYHKQRLQGLEDIVKLMLQQTSPGMNVDEALSLLRSKQSSANSTQDPNLVPRHSPPSTHIPSHD
ncbi:uncharacterized protein LOC127747629 [Arachis duranensis]|uniref:Uncharacterized protein LOC127747629 n=1 Tax=Arachis duranensis TaxID=130453 RepID=A0A9C6TZ86_ARADU|nr:uncharacterized protein LOC127747629 [Arachis duranensis]